MPPTSFRVVRQKLGMWKQFGEEDFDIVAEGEDRPRATVRAENKTGRGFFALTITMEGPEPG